MRRPMIGLAVAFGFSLLAPASQAQGFGNFNDPFTFYYGFYLPHQAAIAAQPTPMDTLNAVTAARQYNAPTNRTGMFDPVSPYGLEDPDIFGAGGRGRGQAMSTPSMNSNARGTGPALYYNRTARYFPACGRAAAPIATFPWAAHDVGWAAVDAQHAQHARRFLSETEDGPGIRPAETSSAPAGFILGGGHLLLQTDGGGRRESPGRRRTIRPHGAEVDLFAGNMGRRARCRWPRTSSG